VIDEDRSPTRGKTGVATSVLRRLLAATCLSAAAALGAYAATLLEPYPLQFNASTSIRSANALPDETVIVDSFPATADAISAAPFSNLTVNLVLKITRSSGQPSSGWEAFDGSNIGFTSQGLAVTTNPTVSASASGDARIFRYNPDQDTDDDSHVLDAAILTFTGLVFVLAGIAGRRPVKNLRRLTAQEARHWRGV